MRDAGSRRYRVLEKLLSGIRRKAVAKEEKLSVSRIAQIKREFPLFFWKTKKSR